MTTDGAYGAISGWRLCRLIAMVSICFAFYKLWLRYVMVTLTLWWTIVSVGGTGGVCPSWGSSEYAGSDVEAMATGNIGDDTRTYGSWARFDSDMATHMSGGGTSEECGRGCEDEIPMACEESVDHGAEFIRPGSGDCDAVMYSTCI